MSKPQHGHYKIRARTYVTSFVVQGEAASKANSRKLVHYGGRVRFIKSAKARTFADLVRIQVRPLRVPIPSGTNVCLNIHMFYASRRPDLDESALLDALQGIIYDNDRQVRERHTYWHLDKVQPRVEVDVYTLADGEEEA